MPVDVVVCATMTDFHSPLPSLPSPPSPLLPSPLLPSLSSPPSPPLVAEKQDKKPPPPIAPYSSQLTGTSPRISPRPAPRSNGESDHSVPVAAVEEVPEPTESSKPPPKPARRSRRNLQKGGDTPPSPRSEGRSEEGGDSEGPAGLSTANGESAVATEDPYLEMEIENCPLRHEGSAHSKVDAQMGSPRAPHLSRDSAHSSIASNHSSIDSAHSSTESTLTSNDPTQPPVEKRRRPPPPPPTHQKQVDRIEKNQLNHLQSSPTDPTVDHEGSPQSPLIQPSSPSPAAASKPTPAGHPAHIEGGIDTAIGSPGNTEMGDSEGNPPSATPLTDSEVAEEKPTTLRPRRKAPPPPIKPTSGQTSSPAVSTDPLHRRRLGSASSLTRSKSLPRSRMRSNQSADSKYNTLGGGARSGSLRHGGHLVLPPSEKEKKKAKLALPGWLKKLSGSPSTKRKTQQESNSASGGLCSNGRGIGAGGGEGGVGEVWRGRGGRSVEGRLGGWEECGGRGERLGGVWKGGWEVGTSVEGGVRGWECGRRLGGVWREVGRSVEGGWEECGGRLGGVWREVGRSVEGGWEECGRSVEGEVGVVR